METSGGSVVLGPGEFYRKRAFGREAVNRGAVLLECEWDGGVFESGMMLGGAFRSGEFREGTFSGGAFRGGRWLGGTWACGFDRAGRYRPRSDAPPHDDPPAVRTVPAADAGAGRIVIASPHRFPDLARLWFDQVTREVVPSFRSRGFEVEVVIFRDTDAGGFDQARFPGARLERPGPRARDFIEFYDASLGFDCEYLLFLDADVFILDGRWAAGHLARFVDPDTAAVSLLSRPDLPGSVYALICRRAAYAALAPPVMAACYEGAERWPDATHRDPGEQAALRLQAAGKRVTHADLAETRVRLADFHGTTNLRVSRELFGRAIGDEAFERLVSGHRYLAMGACDNAMLGALYRARYGEPFAPGPDGSALGGSLDPAAIRRALAGMGDPALLAALRAHIDRSRSMTLRLAARESVRLDLPDLD